MRLGDVANEGAAKYGKPLDGVRVLALEQMQALPYATQLLARLGADVVKIEAPTGESGRGSQPGMTRPDRAASSAPRSCATTSRRSSVTVEPQGGSPAASWCSRSRRTSTCSPRTSSRARSTAWASGTTPCAAVHPAVIYTSLSGFGASGSPYTDWPAYASIAESMSGIYDYVLVGDEMPRPNPVGALGDISSGLFATIGILAALRHRDATGEGQRIDIAMYDATVAMTDIVTNFESHGEAPPQRAQERHPRSVPRVRRLVRDAARARAPARAHLAARRSSRSGPPTRASRHARAGPRTSRTCCGPPSRSGRRT